MKIQTAIEIAKDCELETVGEAIYNDTTQEVIIRNDEQLEFGEWCHDETDGKFIVGTSDSGEKVYFSKGEYERAVSEKRTIELGKEYLFAGYRWVPVEINENWHVAVMQSLGVTAGPWPGFSMENLGNGNHYTHNIDEYDISKYDDKTYALMKQIKPVSRIDGLYLPSFEDINDNQLWKDTLARAASHGSSFGASVNCAWTGPYYGNSGDAWVVNSNGDTYGNYQSGSFVVPAAFNLDLSKIKVVGDEITIIGNDNNDQSKNPSNNGGNFMTNEFAKNIITEYVFADYDISSIYKFLNTETSLDESEKQLYSEALLTRAMQKAVIALSKPV